MTALKDATDFRYSPEEGIKARLLMESEASTRATLCVP